VKQKVSTEQLWSDYCRLGSTKKVAKLHGTCHSNIVQRLHNAGYTLHRPGRRSWWMTGGTT